MSSSAANPCIQFFAFGDFGCECNDLKAAASTMNKLWTETPKGDSEQRFVLLLGDNVYPQGISSESDARMLSVFSDTFPNAYPKTLRVPYFAILGNHDYMDGNPRPAFKQQPEQKKHAQVLFSEHKNNPLIDSERPERCWQLPNPTYDFSFPLAYLPKEEQQVKKPEQEAEEGEEDYSCSSSSSSSSLHPNLNPKVHRIHFCGMDTNVAQFSARRDYPPILEEWPERKSWLIKTLKQSTALFKVVFAHHPLYTKSRMHGIVGDCLRLPEYEFVGSGNQRKKAPGMNLEAEALIPSGANYWLSGHEHCASTSQRHGVDHFVAGCVVEAGLYGGDDPNRKVDFLSFEKSILRGTVTVEKASTLPKDATLGSFAPGSAGGEAKKKFEFVCVVTMDFISTETPGKIIHTKKQVKPI